MSKNYKPTEGFNLKPINHQHFVHKEHLELNSRTASKLRQNPVDRNNLGHESYRSSNHISMDKLSNSLSSEYSEFQNKYYSDSLPKRFYTNNYLVRKFK